MRIVNNKQTKKKDLSQIFFLLSVEFHETVVPRETLIKKKIVKYLQDSPEAIWNSLD